MSRRDQQSRAAIGGGILIALLLLAILHFGGVL